MLRTRYTLVYDNELEKTGKKHGATQTHHDLDHLYADPNMPPFWAVVQDLHTNTYPTQ